MRSDSCSENQYAACALCPRLCQVNRSAEPSAVASKPRSFCGETDQVRLAWAGIHRGEEPSITVFGGSGAIFFSGCNLCCSFCQNKQISQEGMGRVVDCDEFCQICLALERCGAENINLVTASHHVPRVAEYLRCAKRRGLALPIVWNTSSYETPETLTALLGIVDVWLADLKSLSKSVSLSLFLAADYPSVAKRAILWMADHSPLVLCDVKRGDEVAQKVLSGVIVRHLALPGLMRDTLEAIVWIKENLGERVALSLMSQYCPPKGAAHKGCGELWRTLNARERQVLDDVAQAADFALVYKQEAGCEDEQVLPDFSRRSPFPPDLAATVWHWREGFVAPHR